MGRRKRGRDISGVLLLDKPQGMTSNRALQIAKRLFQANKAGHTGSLDPLATGLLPVCLGEATKISAFLLDADKRYQASCRLGQTTTTADSEGEVLESRAVPVLSPRQIKSVLQRFQGEIEQTPPMYSALKHQGQPLYRLARQGQTVDRAPRRVTIYNIDLLSMSAEHLVLDVKCSKGTYIRTLAEDIGAALECGAHIDGLRRTAAAPFDDSALVSLEQLEALAEQGMEALDSLLLPVDAALPGWPKLTLQPVMADYIQQGQAVMVPNAPTEGLLRLYRQEADSEQFFAIGRVLDDGRIGPKRLIFAGK